MATAAAKNNPAKPAAAAPQAPPSAVAPPAAAPAPVYRFAIEDNIAIPERKIGKSAESGYPFEALGIGQSFFVPSTDKMPEPWKTLTSMSSRKGRELHPVKFTTARVKDASGNEGVRVWRVEDDTEALKPPRVINRKPKSAEGSAEALAQEAIEGDTSNRPQPEPMFDDGKGGNPPPPVA